MDDVPVIIGLVTAIGTGLFVAGIVMLGRYWRDMRAVSILGIVLLSAGIVLLAVGLHIGLRSRLVEVPDLAMLGRYEAEERCVRSGLEFTAIPRYSQEVPKDRVIPHSQAPAPAMKVTPGATVTVAISEGPGMAQLARWTLDPPTPGTDDVWPGLAEYPQASGTVEQDGYSLRLVVTGLPANTSFLLTINGIPGQPGNEELAEQGRTTSRGAGFVDLQPPLRTGAGGTLDSRLSLALEPGRYVTKLILRRFGETFPMVLQNERVELVVPEREGVSVSLFQPCSGGSVLCTPDAADVYHFSVQGSSTGVSGSSEVAVLLWVRPVNPPSEMPGWYLQRRPNGLQVVHEDGHWEGKCQIGNREWPPHQGDTLDLAVTVVDREVASRLKAGRGVVVEPILPKARASEEARGVAVDL